MSRAEWNPQSQVLVTWEERVSDDSFAERVKHHLKGRGGVQVGTQSASEVAGVFMEEVVLAEGRETHCSTLPGLRHLSGLEPFSAATGIAGHLRTHIAGMWPELRQDREAAHVGLGRD